MAALRPNQDATHLRTTGDEVFLWKYSTTLTGTQLPSPRFGVIVVASYDVPPCAWRCRIRSRQAGKGRWPPRAPRSCLPFACPPGWRSRVPIRKPCAASTLSPGGKENGSSGAGAPHNSPPLFPGERETVLRAHARPTIFPTLSPGRGKSQVAGAPHNLSYLLPGEKVARDRRSPQPSRAG